MSKLDSSVRALILDEQTRSGGRFIMTHDLDSYLQKVERQGEWLVDVREGTCRGVVAYYANDLQAKRAFITLVLVAPAARGQGLAGALVGGVLDVCRARGFARCGLEVFSDNEAALVVYRRLGFQTVGEDKGKCMMEVAL